MFIICFFILLCFKTFSLIAITISVPTLNLT